MAQNTIVDGELLLHRFDTADENQYWFDEGSGVLKATSAAFTFHDATDTTPIGCSNYRDDVLVSAGLERTATRKRDGQELVAATARDVRNLERNGEKLLDALAEPWPEEPDRSFAADVAHALVSLPDGAGTSSRRKWSRTLSRAFKPVSMEQN